MYVKIFNKTERHKGFEYHDGLNELLEPFNGDTTQTCVSGGLYFTRTDYVHKYYGYGIYIRKISLPENDPEFKMVMDPSGDKWRANKIVLEKRYSLCDPETYKILNLKTPPMNFLVECAVKEDIVDNLNMLKKIYLTNSYKIRLFYEQVCYIAALEKSYNILTWVKNERSIIVNKIYEGAALGGNIDVLNWAIDNYKDLSTNTVNIINNAARRGHLDVLEWVHTKTYPDHNKKCPGDNKKCSCVSERITAMKYQCDNKLYTYAVQNNYYKIIKWAHANYYKWSSPDHYCVNKKTDKKILKWLVRNGYFVNEIYAIISPGNAVIKNNIDLLKWSCKNEEIFKNAINNEKILSVIVNNYDVLKWIHDYDKQLFKNAMSNEKISIKIINEAASDGKLEIIKWMVENGSCWNGYTCKNSARNGFFDCFEYLWLKNCYVEVLNKLLKHENCVGGTNSRASHCIDSIRYIGKTEHDYDFALRWIKMQIYLSCDIIAGLNVKIVERENFQFCIEFNRVTHNIKS